MKKIIENGLIYQIHTYPNGSNIKELVGVEKELEFLVNKEPLGDDLKVDGYLFLKNNFTGKYEKVTSAIKLFFEGEELADISPSKDGIIYFEFVINNHRLEDKVDLFASLDSKSKSKGNFSVTGSWNEEEVK